MKAISLTQPWATLVAIGEKRIETRSWNTNYRGSLLIHASRGFPKYAKELISKSPFQESLKVVDHPLPLGAIIAKCELVATHKIDLDDLDHLRAWWVGGQYWDLDEKELAYGNYAAGRYVWLLDEVQLINPIETKGKLGLWEFDYRIISQGAGQMEMKL